MEFVDQEKSPLELYPMIKEEDWEDFKAVKNSEEFKVKSAAARDLAKTYKNHHKMGTAGYAGSALKWENRI